MEHKEYQVVWKKKIDKQIKKLPADVKNRFLLLAKDLRKKRSSSAGMGQILKAF